MTYNAARESNKSITALEDLRAMIAPGDKVYTILRHVSASGMSRRISLIIVKDGEPISLDWYAERIGLASRRARKEGLYVGGCGMDMGFHLVYNLGQKLWPNGTPEPHGRRNGEPDSAGGYAIKHAWL